MSIVVYDVLGRKVRTLLDDVRDGGDHVVSWDGLNDHGRGRRNRSLFPSTRLVRGDTHSENGPDEVIIRISTRKGMPS